MRTSVTDWWQPLPSMWKNRCLKVRQRLSWDLPIWLPGGPTVNKFVGDFVKTEVDNYLHKHMDVADVMLQKDTGIRERA